MGKQKKYYRFDGSKSVSTDAVLVKWIEDDVIKISSPIKDYNQALNKCQS